VAVWAGFPEATSLAWHINLKNIIWKFPKTWGFFMQFQILDLTRSVEPKNIVSSACIYMGKCWTTSLVTKIKYSSKMATHSNCEISCLPEEGNYI
jgi:hypothetical protein